MMILIQKWRILMSVWHLRKYFDSYLEGGGKRKESLGGEN